MIITTDRLRLRCMEPRDIDPFVRDLCDWEVQQWPSRRGATRQLRYQLVVGKKAATAR